MIVWRGPLAHDVGESVTMPAPQRTRPDQSVNARMAASRSALGIAASARTRP